MTVTGLPFLAVAPVPTIKSLTISFLGGAPLGMVTTGSFDSGPLVGVVVAAVVADVVVVGVGVVAAAVCTVCPPPGASTTPGACELPPHAETASATAAAPRTEMTALKFMATEEGSDPRSIARRRQPAMRSSTAGVDVVIGVYSPDVIGLLECVYEFHKFGRVVLIDRNS